MSLALRSPAWLAMRRQGLGASDMPVVAGVSPYRKPFDLWLEKTEGKAQPENIRMSRGNRLEGVAADWYSEETGRRLARVNRTVRDPHYPHLFCHPDRRVVGEKRLVQIKTNYREWEEVPEHVQVQVQVEMGLSHTDVCDVALMTFETLRVYEVPRNDVLIARLLRLGEAWWERHVIGNEPPRDGSEAFGRWLNRSPQEPPMRASAEQQIAADRLRLIRDVVKRLEAEDSSLVNWLKFTMAGSVELTGAGFKALWRQGKDRTTTDWKGMATGALALAKALRDHFSEDDWQSIPPELRAVLTNLDGYESLHQTTEQGHRPFRVTFEEGTE